MKKLARSTYSKIAFFITGIGSLVWFLMRVIPKPSRAGYPCMRAAAPVASAFVLYVLGLFATAAFFKKSKKFFSQSRHVLASIFLIAGICSAMLTTFTSDKPLYADIQAFDQPVNAPMGSAKGIYPGRVVMIHNPDATNYSCPNTLSNPYWSNSYNTQTVVDNMVSAAIQTLTGTNTDAAAWDAIFKYYNQAHGKGSVDYSSIKNEKIFIKTNSVSGYSWNSTSKEPNVYNAETTPQVVLAVLRQLVNNAGVPKNNIYVGDPMRHIYQHCYTMWYPEFSGVHFLDNTITTDGRELAVKGTTNQVFYSDKGTVLGASVTSDRLYQIFSDTEYLINLPQLKAHARAGISMFAKNHFGSHTRSSADHLHLGLVDPQQNGGVRTGTPPLYRTQVDLMAHRLLGGKTLFYLLDALWAGSEAVDPPTKWSLTPFNCENAGGDWTSAIIASQDPVAVESVGFDLLRNEYSNYPNMQGVDDYLHQTADPSVRPGANLNYYDPENDGVALTTSLGVHEHWNNAANKEYTRNLGTGSGIEFLYTRIITSGVLSPFGTTQGTPSEAQTYTVSGNCLMTDITVSAPAGFQISTNGTNYYSSLTLTPTLWMVPTTTIYVRLTGAATGTFNGNITHSTKGATSVNVPVSGAVGQPRLEFVSFPSSGIINTGFTTFTVEARRINNTVDNTFNGTVTLSKASGPTTGTLSGTLTFNAVSGIATFSDVQVNEPGSYTLNATTGGSFQQATSGTINVSSGTATVGDYRSNAATMNWSSSTGWQRYNGSSWVTTTTPPTASDDNTITIRNGHTITIDANVTADQVVVESGGQLRLTSGTLTIANGTGDDFVVNGTLYRSGGTITTTGNLVFGAGGTYQHALNGSSIPSATWNTASTCLVTGVTGTVPTGLNPPGGFGNFTWNCTGQTSTIYLASNMTVKGDFTIVSTGGADHQNRSLRMTNTTTGYTINVGGNFNVQSPATFKMNNNAGSCVLNIAGNLNIAGQSSGTTGFYLNSSGSAGSSATVNLTGDLNVSSGYLIFSDDGGSRPAILNLAGDFNHTGGSIQNNSTNSGYVGTVNFTGTGMQTFNSTGVTSGHLINFTVNNGAYLQMGSAGTVINGAGTFTLSKGATLGITSPTGIVATGYVAGNIQVIGNRSYGTGANYIYNGAGAQSTGNGLPATVSNLTFDNAGVAVTFTSACSITNNFSVTAGSAANLGIWSHTAGSLTLGGALQVNCTYGGTGSSAGSINSTYFGPATGVVTVGNGNDCVSPGMWLGGTSVEWNVAGNWYGNNIPASGTNVFITSGAVRQPVISGPTTALCNRLTVYPGAALTIAPAGKATFASIINNGTLNLSSDALGIASLIVDTYTGNPANIQMYLTGGGDAGTYAWHFISSPVQGLPTSTFTGTTYDLARYVESLPVNGGVPPYSFQRGWIGYDGWNYYTSDGLPYNEARSFDENGPVPNGLRLGLGYNYWHDLDEDPDPDPVTYTFPGAINTSAVSSALSYSGVDDNLSGYNLLGNPFTCGLNWDNITASGYPQNTGTMIYFTRNSQSCTYQNGVGNPSWVNGHIPPMQGFFVKTGTGFTSGSVLLTTAAREHNTTSRYKGDKASISLVRLSITENEKSYETVVRFDNEAKSGADLYFDAPVMFLSPDVASIYTSLGSRDFNINGLPFPETSVEIPVNVNLLKEGSHVITAIEIQELASYKVSLKDITTGSTVDLNSVKEYSFSAPAGLVKDRFILTVTNISTGIEDPVNEEDMFSIYHGFGNINILPLSDQWDGMTGSIKVMDLSGKTIISQQDNEFRKNTLIRIPFNGTKGIYIVEIKSVVNRYTGKVSVR
jgi:hypothetical protein